MGSCFGFYKERKNNHLKIYKRWVHAKDQNQRVEDCETIRTGKRKRKEVEKEEEWDTEEREKRATGASQARGQRRNTLLGDAPLFRAHPDNHPQSSHLEQAVSSSFFRWGNCSAWELSSNVGFSHALLIIKDCFLSSLLLAMGRKSGQQFTRSDLQKIYSSQFYQYGAQSCPARNWKRQTQIHANSKTYVLNHHTKISHYKQVKWKQSKQSYEYILIYIRW